MNVRLAFLEFGLLPYVYMFVQRLSFLVRKMVIINYLEEFREASNKGSSKPPHSLQVPARPRWVPPPVGFVAISVDAAISTTVYRCGVGGVVRSSSGGVIASFAYPMDRGFSPLTAELWAILKGLEFARDRGFNLVVIQADCAKAVSLISQEGRRCTEAGMVTTAIKNTLSGFESCRFLFHSRVCNVVAHGLAKRALSLLSECVWEECVPPELVDHVLADMPR